MAFTLRLPSWRFAVLASWVLALCSLLVKEVLTELLVREVARGLVSWNKAFGFFRFHDPRHPGPNALARMFSELCVDFIHRKVVISVGLSVCA